MAKSLDTVKPRSFDNDKWIDKVTFLNIKNGATDFTVIRVLEGVFSYGVHWVKVKKKDGTIANVPLDCYAYDVDLDDVDPDKVSECPCCQLGMKVQVKYLFNVIDRKAQKRKESQYIKALELSPTIVNKMITLRNLNLVDGVPTSVANAEYGIDLHLMKSHAGGKQYPEIDIQRGDRTPLTKEERNEELFEFEEIVKKQDVANARRTLIRGGYLNQDGTPRDPDADDSEDSDDSADMPPAKSVKAGGGGVSTGVAQLPPRAASKAVEVEDDDTDGDGEEPELPKAVAAVAKSSEPAAVASTKKTALPKAEKPDCYTQFRGDMTCLKCDWREPCLVVSPDVD